MLFEEGWFQLVGWQELDACLIVQCLTALGVRAMEVQFQ